VLYHVLSRSLAASNQ